MASSHSISTSPRGGLQLVEDALCLRVRDLRRRGFGWVAADLTAADGTLIRCRVEVADDTAAWLHLEHHRPGTAWATSSYSVALVPVPQHLGGVRWLFRDPDGFGLCSALYLPPGGGCLASRQAHSLSHRSQRQRAPARAADRAHRLAADLGASVLDVPTRPKGMWASTYARRAAALARLVEVASAV